jgi:hypothetical protein
MFPVVLINRSDAEDGLNMGKDDLAIINTKSPIAMRANITPATVILSSFTYFKLSFWDVNMIAARKIVTTAPAYMRSWKTATYGAFKIQKRAPIAMHMLENDMTA